MPFADYLNQTAAISSRSQRPRSGFGEGTPQFTPVPGQGALPCLVRPIRVEAAARQGRDTSERWARIYFAVDPAVTNDDLITVDGLAYAVKGEINFNSMGEAYGVDCVLTKT